MSHAHIKEFDDLTRPDRSAALLGYRMPGEFEALGCVWVVEPKNEETWPGCLDEARGEFADWVGLMRKAVRVRTTDELGIETNDSWVRDFGPTFVVRDSGDGEGGAIACHDFHFNTWGGKYEVREKDDVVPQRIARELGIPIWVHDFVLEGGSIDVNGQGVVMTTEQCLLNPNRNPGLTREQIEAELHGALGTRHVIWLPGGLKGDDTDGHIDDVARFVSADTVVAVSAPRGHPDYEVTRKNLDVLRESVDQDGRALRVVELPAPEPIYHNYPDGRSQVPASYANFLIANGYVFVPAFGQPADGLAADILTDEMKGFTVISVSSKWLVVGLGALHCLSQQQPVGGGG
jgi:agmatine deiminase